MQQEKQDWQKMSYLTGEPNLQYFLAYIFIYLWVYLFIYKVIIEKRKPPDTYLQQEEGRVHPFAGHKANSSRPVAQHTQRS